MRSSVFLAIIALCAIADGASAVARAGGAGSRAGKSSGSGRSSNGSNTGGDRDRPGKTKTTPAARRKRDKTVFSDDGAKIGGRDPSTVVIGAVREERAYQQFGSQKRLWDKDDVDEEQEEEEYDDDDDDDWGDGEENEYDATLDEEDEDEEGEGGGSFFEETDLSEDTEEEELEEGYGTGGRGGGRGSGHGRSTRKPAAGAAYGSGARSSSSSHPSRRTHYGNDDFGRGERRGRGAGLQQASGRKKAKAKGGVMKSVGKATGSSMKAMVHALQPKAVGLGEILDTWKIEQIIGKPPGRVTKCAATVEFRRDGTVATSFDGRETVSDFTFRAHAWPRACTIEFEAKAFQGPWDEEPVWKVYKGSFSRKLLDPKIITLEGTIYDVMGKMMWKRRVKSGKFTARRRPSRLSRGGGGASSSRRGTTPDREADERWGEGARATGDGSGGEGTRRKGKGKGKETGAGKGSRRTRSARPAGSGRSGRRDRDEL